MWQTTAYWIMGAMSNDPAKLANLTGFCEYCRRFVMTWWIVYSVKQTSHYSRQQHAGSGVQTLWAFHT